MAKNLVTVKVVLKTGQEFDVLMDEDRAFGARSLTNDTVHLMHLSTDKKNLVVQGDNISHILFPRLK